MRPTCCQHLVQTQPDADEQRVSYNAAIAIDSGGVIDWTLGDVDRVPRIVDDGACRQLG
jgi:hypothetical protein